MPKVGIISNAASRRNQNGADPLEQLRNRPDILFYRLQGMETLPSILGDLAKREAEVLVISGGDGTVQAVLTCLLTNDLFERPPQLAVHGRGMTNMIAADVGLRRRPLQAIAKIVRGEEGVSTSERRVLKVTIPGQACQFGMFFGCAGIYRAIQTCRRDIHPMGATADNAIALTLLSLLWRGIWRSETETFQGDQIDVRINGTDRGIQPYLAIFATTLNRLALGARPFWGRGSGPVRYTHVTSAPRGLWWRIPLVMYGRSKRQLPAPDYFSCGARKIRLVMACPFTIDGELFDARRDEPIEITADQRVTFARI